MCVFSSQASERLHRIARLPRFWDGNANKSSTPDICGHFVLLRALIIYHTICFDSAPWNVAWRMRMQQDL